MWPILLVVIVNLGQDQVKIFHAKREGCEEVRRHKEAHAYWVQQGLVFCPAPVCLPDEETGYPDPECGRCTTKFYLHEVDCFPPKKTGAPDGGPWIHIDRLLGNVNISTRSAVSK